MREGAAEVKLDPFARTAINRLDDDPFNRRAPGNHRTIPFRAFPLRPPRPRPLPCISPPLPQYSLLGDDDFSWLIATSAPPSPSDVL